MLPYGKYRPGLEQSKAEARGFVTRSKPCRQNALE
jgi:hypothetical protein